MTKGLLQLLLASIVIAATIARAEPYGDIKLCRECPDNVALCCKPGLDPGCSQETIPQCPAPRPRMLCQVSIIYPEDDATKTRMLEMAAWCDEARMHQAISGTLARLLAVPRDQ